MVLLLATAVILPTVCLLWFMTKAVQNERLAVRQKLVDTYRNRAARLTARVPEQLLEMTKEISASADFRPDDNPDLLAEKTSLDGYVVFEGDGPPVYPLILENDPPARPPDSPLGMAWRLEFTDTNDPGALALYQKIEAESTDYSEYLQAQMGAVRCLVRMGQPEKAKEWFGRQSVEPHHFRTGDEETWTLMLRTRVMWAQLLHDTNDVGLREYLAAYLGDQQRLPGSCDTRTRAWATRRLIGIAEDAGLKDELAASIFKAQTTIAADELSLEAVELFASPAALGDWPAQTIRRIRTSQNAYGVHFKTQYGHALCLLRPERLQFSTLTSDVEDPAVTCRIVDNEGNIAAGDVAIETEPFVRAGMGKWLPEWKLEFFFRDASVFEAAASRQAAIYVWVAILVISLIGSVAVTSGVSINRQMRLNRLRNNFIATVTHELKTPLSSMRVLVDTLLAGDCKDQRQEREYLELIAKENLRLSRLIDNFLTFSRMERNKKAFDIHPSSPAAIVDDAAEAVKTKFENSGCQFEHAVADGMPEVMADHDAAVTVLVNLLDNACKYSDKYKRIGLKAFVENGEVCFAVRDNGVGMTRRVMRRIFDRFYQADQSLARSTEGCGLGLAIVKFIVDAHKGRIDVESKPGEGSCFTVRLPAAELSQN